MRPLARGLRCASGAGTTYCGLRGTRDTRSGIALDTVARGVLKHPCSSSCMPWTSRQPWLCALCRGGPRSVHDRAERPGSGLFNFSLFFFSCRAIRHWCLTLIWSCLSLMCRSDMGRALVAMIRFFVNVLNLLNPTNTGGTPSRDVCCNNLLLFSDVLVD